MSQHKHGTNELTYLYKADFSHKSTFWQFACQISINEMRSSAEILEIHQNTGLTVVDCMVGRLTL